MVNIYLVNETCTFLTAVMPHCGNEYFSPPFGVICVSQASVTRITSNHQIAKIASKQPGCSGYTHSFLTPAGLKRFVFVLVFFTETSFVFVCIFQLQPQIKQLLKVAVVVWLGAPLLRCLEQHTESLPAAHSDL